MELCNRGDLANYLFDKRRRQSPLNEQVVRSWMGQVPLKSPGYSQKSPIFLQKSHRYSQKSLMFLQKSPVFLCTSSTSKSCAVWCDRFHHRATDIRKKPSISAKDPIFLQKSLMFPLKCPRYPQKRPIFLQNSPLFLRISWTNKLCAVWSDVPQKSPLDIRKRALCISKEPYISTSKPLISAKEP